MNKIVALVVTYNRVELLKKCIAKLMLQSVDCFDILVVDNNSSDKTVEYMNSITSARVKYYRMPENLGGAGGFSVGMRRCAELSYEKIWLMDDDTMPESGALEALLAADRSLHGDYGFLSSVALWKDNSPCLMNRQLFPTRSTADVSQYRDGRIFCKIECASFVSMLVKTQTVFSYGLPIKEFFIWADDAEYSTRIAAKENCYLVNDSIVIHEMAENTPTNLAKLPEERIARMTIAVRNQYYIARRDGFKRQMLYFRRQVKVFLEVIFTAKDHRLKRVFALFKGVILGLRFKPKVEFLD